MIPKKINKENISIGWFLIFVLFLSLQMAELHGLALITEWLFLITAPIVAYLIKDDRKTSNQMIVVVLFFGMVWGFGIINKLAHKNNKDIILIGAIAFLLSFIFLFKQLFNTVKSINYIKQLKYNIVLVIIIVVFFVFAYETIFEIPWHDAEYYYCWDIKQIAYWFDYTWNDIGHYTLALHPTLGYAMIALLAELIHSQSAIVLHTFNITLAIISAVSLYRILELIYPSKKRSTKALLTGIYLFSPWLLGIIGFINIDVPSVYFFVILISCFLHKKRLLEVVFCFLFVFTKEPSIVYYAFLCVGILISDYLLNKKENKSGNSIVNFGKFFFEELIKYIPEILVAVSWLFCFLVRFSSSWGAVQGDIFNNEDKMHCFGFTTDNLVMKTKGVLLINFNWIFVIIIIIAIIKCIVCKLKGININENNNVIIIYYRSILYFTFIGFTLFNLLYIDLDHPRYNAIGAVILILIGIDLINYVIKEKVVRFISLVIALLMLTQSMVTIDPVTRNIYPKVESFGSNTMVNYLLFVYNREYSYYFNAIEEVLIQSNYDGDEDIVLCGLPGPFGPMNDFWWDTKNHRMCPSGYNRKNVVMMNFIWDSEIYNKFDENHETRIYIYPYSYSSQDVKVASYRTIKLKYEVENVNNLRTK